MKTLKTAIALTAGLGLAWQSGADDKPKPKTKSEMPMLPDPRAPHDVPDPSAPKNTLRWTTNQLNNYAYDIFRAEAEAGPFQKINAEPVPGGGKAAANNQFEYVDASIDPHKAYWYYVDSIDLMGKRARFTPTQKVAPKLPIDAAPAPAPR